MPGRRKRARCIGFDPDFICFKPCGRPGRGMETLELGADELEALRLSDFEDLYQEECARRMGISRTTLSRTLATAHRKVADALLHFGSGSAGLGLDNGWQTQLRMKYSVPDVSRPAIGGFTSKQNRRLPEFRVFHCVIQPATRLSFCC